MDNLVDDGSRLTPFHSFEFQSALTCGNDHPAKRRQIRQAALKEFPVAVPKANWWAFRIHVEKCGVGRFDIENVPKLIVDSFCRKQIEEDASKENRPKQGFERLGLYPDDTIDCVRMIQVSGERRSHDRTCVEILACMH